MGFDAFEVSLQVIGAVKAVVEIVRTGDGDLADQMRRAATSVSLNVAEGVGRSGKDRVRCWRIAEGSARELLAALLVAREWGLVSPSALSQSMELLDRELAMLFRLTHARA